MAESAFCDCGEGDQTPEHVLQACPHSLTMQLRHQTWQPNTTLDSKLWGSLCRTTHFMTAAGLRV